MFDRRHRLLGDCVASVLAASGLDIDRLEPHRDDARRVLGGHRLVVVDSAVLDDAGSGVAEELQEVESSVLVVATDPTHSEEYAGHDPDEVIEITDDLPTLVGAVHRLLRLADRDSDPAPASAHHVEFDDPLVRLASLSPREEHVLEGMMRGLSAAEIAEAQYVSVATVRSQIRSILAKLDVRSQLAAVALAHEAGWHADGRRNSSNLAIRPSKRCS